MAGRQLLVGERRRISTTKYTKYTKKDKGKKKTEGKKSKVFILILDA
jgi:hypothetical protein